MDNPFRAPDAARTARSSDEDLALRARLEALEAEFERIRLRPLPDARRRAIAAVVVLLAAMALMLAMAKSY